MRRKDCIMATRFRLRRPCGFTIVELLVVISIIALLVGILLPAISKARDSAKVTESLANLRNMASAHQSYAAEWNDRQFTLNRDDIGAYGGVAAYEAAVGELPPLILGYAYNPTTGGWGYVFSVLDFLWPIHPDNDPFGWFRLPNVRNFNQYVNSRFYDKTFYAPKDKIVIETIGEFFDLPGEFAYDPSADILAYYSSYCLSPAALFAPKVFDYKDCDLHAQGQDTMGAGAFRTPSMSQARFPSLKTHMLEHHWLQNNRGLRCNPLQDGGYDNDCEPYYFNASMDSAPCTMYFDGSVRIMSCREVGTADQGLRVQGQTTFDEPTNAGLYFRPGDAGFTEAAGMSSNGYYLDITYDDPDAASSAGVGGYAIGHHILTKDGILGRDTTGGN
jgi:prepilin-type N-terminal cleavage/methylation domain-containing protein